MAYSFRITLVLLSYPAGLYSGTHSNNRPVLADSPGRGDAERWTVRCLVKQPSLAVLLQALHRSYTGEREKAARPGIEERFACVLRIRLEVMRRDLGWG